MLYRSHTDITFHLVTFYSLQLGEPSILPWSNLQMSSAKQVSTKYHFKSLVWPGQELNPWPPKHQTSTLPLHHWVWSGHLIHYLYTNKIASNIWMCLYFLKLFLPTELNEEFMVFNTQVFVYIYRCVQNGVMRIATWKLLTVVSDGSRRSAWSVAESLLLIGQSLNPHNCISRSVLQRVLLLPGYKMVEDITDPAILAGY